MTHFLKNSATIMVFYNIYVFNKSGICVYYEQWNRTTRPATNLEDEQNLLYGMLYQFKLFVANTSPKPEQETNGFHYFRTTAYKLHYYETMSGFRIVLNTDPNVSDLRSELKQVHALLTDFVVKDPFYTPGDNITSPLFVNQLNTYLQSLSAYN